MSGTYFSAEHPNDAEQPATWKTLHNVDSHSAWDPQYIFYVTTVVDAFIKCINLIIGIFCKC